ncbi:MAG: hypothetical protein LUD84_06085 [Clostridiales bacterium]|nr:hypothetical protein [Clostridiales bacterium]
MRFDCETCNLGGAPVEEEAPKNTNLVNKLMSTMSGVLAPTLGVLTAAGIPCSARRPWGLAAAFSPAATWWSPPLMAP